MATITINVIPSTEQILSGIPSYVSITTNIPAMIFYTLDGTDPDSSSDVYISEIQLPTNVSGVTLKVLATDGNDSATLSQYFGPNITNARLPHSKAEVITKIQYNAPGCTGGNPKVVYSQPGATPVHQEANTPIGGDGYGSDPSQYPMREYDQEIPIFSLKYSNNVIGSLGKQIGKMPAKTTIVYTPSTPETSNMNNKLYNSKAMVLFHDGTKPNANKNIYFKPNFCGEDLNTDMYGTRRLTTSQADSIQVSGSFVNYYYNPKDNTLNFYYYCNRTQRWIISKEAYPTNVQNKSPNDYNLISPNYGDNHVYKWMLFKRSAL